MVRFTALAASVAIASASSQGLTRRLEDVEQDISWMSGYSLMYENCFHQDQVASFRLCPEGYTCEAKCEGGGEYLVDLDFFIDAFTEAQMGAHEYRCEYVRENCQYDDEDQCYQEAGLNDCDRDEDENGFNLQEYLECKQVEDGVYIGPYCAEDNYSIYLGVFEDEECTYLAEDASAFYNAMGYSLPYAEVSIVDNECARCKEHGAEQDQAEGDQDDDDDVLEQCEELYENALKCEENVAIDYADTSSCEYLSELKSSEDVTEGAPSTREARAARRRTMIGIFLAALVLACCGFGCFWMYKKNKDNVQTTASNEQLI